MHIDLTTLLSELRSEVAHSDVVAGEHSEALLFLDESDDPIKFNAEECKLVFATVETVDRLLEALDFPEEASLVLTEIRLSDPVQAYLECKFLSVDEG